MNRTGVLAGGNWIIDQVKVIDAFPEQEKLVNILSECNSNGGSAYNILKDLAKLEARFPLEAVGLVGDDERGSLIISECAKLGIDSSQLQQLTGTATAYTDVMTVHTTGKRTFFYQRGANAQLAPANFDFSRSAAKIFHLGYLLLLDELDRILPDGTTGAAALFKCASEKGFITTADIVSEKSDRFQAVIPASLPYLDYLFVNEYEAGKITGIETEHAVTGLQLENCYLAAAKILQMGVRLWVILHFPDGAIAVHKDGEKLYQPSVALPAQANCGSVGAGDAFAAGVLMGIHDDAAMDFCLKQGVCAAASSLLASTSSDGVLPAGECLQLSLHHGFRKQFFGLTMEGQK